MFQDIRLEELLEMKQQQKVAIVDVRSPSEFANGNIPGSINIPVFTDDERAEVGTLYKQESVSVAKQRGLEIMSAKLPQFISTFSEIHKPKVVYCWRGGMRSKTAATVIDLMDIPVLRLEGGIRAYRNWVVDTLETFEMKPITYSLNGYTGTGKTIILESLQRENYPVIDLEGMAAHRGSIFGQIGLEPSNQKTFDAQLLDKLLSFRDSPFILMEAESRRIGKVILPDFLLREKEQGTQILVDIPIEERVKNILDDYQPWKDPKEFIRAFKIIKRRIHTPIATEIEKNLLGENYSEAVYLLLKHYYDPRYDHTINQYPDARNYTIKANNVQEAIAPIKELLKNIHVQLQQT
ncbi:tRNA 2-selenouridine(34) synthase MnmH [Aquibacillus rhizosphaerae]|uniref:tRNA 2-selenouridine(34) synthase MnmH n=1 Tax=Aquibacillus rhizosphaerae TaxID=3051431 RepID=A0ABT7LBX4_9BACI|nr:tRNA 2-selenouridine(34) synthase MnmH [Aquibacillus sp. LR5S19]MDL4842782.1 tRNA 2-selenouridine(34) synthase MnmH [Aquibacillus sp. LR5S19]